MTAPGRRKKSRAVTELADNDFNRHGIEELFQQIMSMSRKLQYQSSRPERRGRPASLYRCGRDRAEIPGPGGLPGRGRSLQRGGDESLFSRMTSLPSMWSTGGMPWRRSPRVVRGLCGPSDRKFHGGQRQRYVRPSDGV